jgi:hypothetical protein
MEPETQMIDQPQNPFSVAPGEIMTQEKIDALTKNVNALAQQNYETGVVFGIKLGLRLAQGG